MKQEGQIQVTIQTEQRLHAINKLSEAVSELAKALNTEPRVEITNCTVNQAKHDGIVVKTADVVERTEIVKLGETP